MIVITDSDGLAGGITVWGKKFARVAQNQPNYFCVLEERAADCVRRLIYFVCVWLNKWCVLSAQACGFWRNFWKSPLQGRDPCIPTYSLSEGKVPPPKKHLLVILKPYAFLFFNGKQKLKVAAHLKISWTVHNESEWWPVCQAVKNCIKVLNDVVFNAWQTSSHLSLHSENVAFVQ